MSAQPTVEQRLAALETLVADLQRRLDEGAPPTNWIDRLGLFKDIPEVDFQEFVRLGREALRRGEMEEDGGPPA